MQTRDHEPVLKAPLAALSLPLAILGLYALQSQLGDTGRWAFAWGLIPADVAAGRLTGLFTSMLLHGDWAHAGMNAAAAFAFAAPVARRTGTGLAGALSLYAFVILCGLIAGLGYVALNPGSPAPVIGASGAVSGLVGAGVRMLWRPAGLAPLFERRTLTIVAALVMLNLAVGVIGLSPTGAVVSIAWEAHIVGLLAGLLLIGPWLALFGPRPPRASLAPADPGEARAEAAEGPAGPWSPPR